MSWLSRLFRRGSQTPSNPAAELPKGTSETTTATMPRRLLVMLRELHRMGYERLRAVTGLSPSGCHWRLQVTPAIGLVPVGQGVDFMARQNRGVAVGDWVVYASGNHAFYSTGYSEETAARCFGWTDAAADSPRKLAEKLIERFPTVVREGKGSDPDYVRWYANMIEATEPEGLIYMYADWELPGERIPVLNVEGVCIPPPPRAGDAQAVQVSGNPFRPVRLDRRWLTSNVVGLAQTIHEDHSFNLLPILADALQEACCDNEDILTHCRGPGQHDRGCWVVDLLLGKE
jgi:hypothetical protein